MTLAACNRSCPPCSLPRAGRSPRVGSLEFRCSLPRSSCYLVVRFFRPAPSRGGFSSAGACSCGLHGGSSKGGGSRNKQDAAVAVTKGSTTSIAADPFGRYARPDGRHRALRQPELRQTPRSHCVGRDGGQVLRPVRLRISSLFQERRLRRRGPAAGGRRRPSSPRPTSNFAHASSLAVLTEPRSRTTQGSVGTRRVKGASRRCAIERVRPWTRRLPTNDGSYPGTGRLWSGPPCGAQMGHTSMSARGSRRQPTSNV